MDTAGAAVVFMRIQAIFYLKRHLTGGLLCGVRYATSVYSHERCTDLSRHVSC